MTSLPKLTANRPNQHLSQLKFYLSIEDHCIEKRIETLLRKIGCSVEFFFTKEVTHFITDKHIDGEPILSKSPLFSSKSKDASLPPKQTTPLSQPKNRADAMVQRARKITEQQTNTLSIIESSIPTPIQLARNSGIPIWTTDYTLKFVEKVSLSRKISKNDSIQSHYRHHHQHQKLAAKAKSLSGEYIKIESTQKHYRPYYQEFKSWPMINFNCSVCPFQSPSDKKTKTKTKQPTISAGTSTTKEKEAVVEVVTNRNDNNISVKSIKGGNNSVPKSHITMTRKTRNRQMRKNIDLNDIKTNNDGVNPNSNDKGGYCEKCRIEYDVLSLHLQSKEHLNFVQNNDNYIALDNLMNSGTDVKTFLCMNSNQVNSGIDTNCIRSPRTNSFDSNKMAENNGVSVIENHKQKIKILPKYSPPITRRSQTKSIIDFTDDEDDTGKSINDTNDKFKNDKSINPTDFDLNGDVENIFLKTDDNSFRKKAMKPNKATTNSNKKTKNAPPDESPPMPKRLIRAFPRYKLIDDPGATKMTDKPAKTTKNNAAVVEKINEAHATTDDNLETDAAGLIVKFKRVRETELSKLTYEADNFMFPKQRDELPTDEDRQSTSEHCDGDLSSDILSSEYNSQRESLPSSLNNSLNRSATSVDQFTSSGRRRKRRSQFDTFKSPMEPKRKFRTSLIQSRLSSIKGTLSLTTSTANETQTSPVDQTKRSAKSSATKAGVLKARSNQAISSSSTSTTTTTTVTSPTTTTLSGSSSNDMLDDRMGENAYNGGKLLATEYFQNLKFSFERVPSNEPWYLTFQRQDEHRESMFEYWGNTAYRKLPFELGPLPPLQSDCCILSKIAAIKASKKSKRRIRFGKLKCQPSVSSDEMNIKKEECDFVNDTVDSTTDSATGSRSKSNEIKASIGTKQNIKGESIEIEDRIPQTSTLSQLLLADSSLNSISLPSAIPNKKKGMLLDASGQPRKSPREHASTLAILSSLVQQRRKRIKEMNGGISPEKMPSYKAAVAAKMAAQNSAENSEIDDNDDTNDIDERFQIKANTTNEIITRRRSNQTPISELNNKTIVETIDMNPSCSQSSDKIFRLRKGKRRQTESVSSNNESIVSKTDKIDETPTSEKDKQTIDLDQLKIPIDEYVDPNKLVRELDEMLDHCYNPDSELNQIMVDYENDCSDLISISAPKDFVEIVESVKDGPLTYRSLQRGKKRHINKTGWPSLPKRRLMKREKIDSIESIESNMEDTTTGINTDDDTAQLNHNFDDGDNFDVDFDETRTMRLNRQHIRTPFCDDNAIQFAVFASSSEKAENSDIFTVSSDSYLDTDAINDTNMAKSPLSADSNATEDDGSISDDKIVNHRSNNESTLEEQRTNETASTSGIVTTSILERTLKNMSTRSTYLRSPTMKDSIDYKLQPLVCVQKIPECDLPPNQWINNSIRQNSSNRNDEEIQLTRTLPTIATTSPLKTKTSPRKLRKPRGRWYRES